jgi:hypothetical protein
MTNNIGELNSENERLCASLGKERATSFNLKRLQSENEQLQRECQARGIPTVEAAPVEDKPPVAAAPVVLVQPAGLSADAAVAWRKLNPNYAKLLEVQKLEAQLSKFAPGSITHQCLSAAITSIKATLN